MFSLQSDNSIAGLGLLESLLQDFIKVVPNLLIALIILIVGWIVAKLIANVVKKVLVALKVDRLGEKLQEIEFIHKSGVKISIAAFASKLIYYTLMFVFLVVAVEKLGVQAITAMMADMIAFIPKLISAILILLFGVLLADKLREILATSMQSLGIASSGVISKAVFYFLLLNIFVVAMSQSGIAMDFLTSNITVLIGGVAAAFAIAYGFASRTLASNTISSFYAKDDIQLGQTISIDGVKGKVVSMGNRNVTLESEEGSVIIPFSRLMEKTIIIHK